MRKPLLLAASLLCGACSSTSEPSSLKTYTGQYSVQVVESTVTVSLQGGGTFPCTNTYNMSGTITLKVDQSTRGESNAIVERVGRQRASADDGMRRRSHQAA